MPTQSYSNFGLGRGPWAAVAQKIQILLIDDLDGSAAEGTVASGWTAGSCGMLTRYVNAARRAGSSARKPARGSRGPVAA
jgi:hypothetical protein